MPAVVELFAGAGGAARGLHAAGFSHLALFERDPVACATLRYWLQADANAVVEGDLADGDVFRAMQATPDGLLWASPPCQLHSRANSRRRDDAFDGWPLTLAAITYTSPQAVIIENVLAARDVALSTWAPDLLAVGYRTRLITADAQHYGVAQTRRRIFLVAHEDEAALDAFEADFRARAQAPLGMGSALPVLARCTSGPGGRCPDCGEVVYPPSCGRAGTERDRLNRPAPTVMTTEVRGTRASASSDFDFNGGPDRASDAAFLAVGRRRLTPAECAALQGFPSSAGFAGTTEEIYRQIGNAVPPPLAEALGRSAISTLF